MRRLRRVGFVVMPDHVHAMRLFREGLSAHAGTFDLAEPVWQPRYDDFNLDSRYKVEEKLASMHQNPVRSGLVAHPCDWPWSSARYSEWGRTVGVPVGWLD